MSRSTADERVDTLVIGAGISGLAFAHALGAGADVVVLDGAAQVGGWLCTREVGEAPGARFELGAEALSDPDGERAKWCAECGIEILRPPPDASRRYLVKDGKLVALPNSPTGLFTTSLLSSAGKLRAFSEIGRDPKLALDGSVADFVRHRFGREVLENLADAFISGVFAGDPEQISLRAAFPVLAAMVEEHGSVLRGLARKKQVAGSMFKPAGGMQRLPEGLARGLGSRLRLGTRVRELERVPDGFLAISDAGRLHARRAVVATDRSGAAALLASVAPLAARELAAMSAESLVAVVHGWDRDQVAHPLDGFGFLAPSREGLSSLGTLFSSSIDPTSAPGGQVVLRTLLGGARRPRLLEESDERLTQIVIDENSRLLGLARTPRWTRVLRYRGVLPRFDLDQPRRVAAIEADVRKSPGLVLLCNAIRGPGIAALVAHARAEATR